MSNSKTRETANRKRTIKHETYSLFKGTEGCLTMDYKWMMYSLICKKDGDGSNPSKRHDMANAHCRNLSEIYSKHEISLISLNENSLICALNPGAFERIIQVVNTKL